jgi:hypothetical protein
LWAWAIKHDEQPADAGAATEKMQLFHSHKTGYWCLMLHRISDDWTIHGLGRNSEKLGIYFFVI